MSINGKLVRICNEAVTANIKAFASKETYKQPK